MVKLRKRKPSKMVSLWRGTVFDSNLCSSSNANHDDEKAVILLHRWLMRQLGSIEYLKNDGPIEYINSQQVRTTTSSTSCCSSRSNSATSSSSSSSSSI